MAEVLEKQGLPEAFQALAAHCQEDADHWLRRLACLEREPDLRALRAALERDYLEVFRTPFRRWGAGGAQGERVSDLEAALALAALRGAERLWLEGRGRPMLPVLAQEALAVVWPSIYAHARRHHR